MSGRRRQWLPLWSDWPHNPLGTALLEHLGPEALAVWPAFITATKRNLVQGQIEYPTDTECWTTLGFGPVQPFGFTLDEFFAVTARMKQTRKTKRARVTYVVWTRFGGINNAPRTRHGRNMDVDRTQHGHREKARSEVAPTAPLRRLDSDSESEIERDSDSLAVADANENTAALLPSLGSDWPEKWTPNLIAAAEEADPRLWRECVDMAKAKGIKHREAWAYSPFRERYRDRSKPLPPHPADRQPTPQYILDHMESDEYPDSTATTNAAGGLGSASDIPADTARGDAGRSTDLSEPARTLVATSDGTDTAETIEQGRLFETTSTFPHDTPLIGADPEANGLVPLGPAFEEEIAHATQLTIEKEALK